MPLMPVADALARVLEGADALPVESVALNEADGRVLAEDLVARRTQPPDAVSAMDGYAVRASDIAGAPGDDKLALHRMPAHDARRLELGVRCELFGEPRRNRRHALDLQMRVRHNDVGRERGCGDNQRNQGSRGQS